jgi:Na+-translocating ferredoxin:NAD+ oxidoreductase RnfG subunit
MFKKACIALLLCSSIAWAQQPQKPEPPLHEVSNKDVVKSVYPEAANVVKANDYWFKVINSNKRTIGFAMISSNFCKDVKGYNDVTPVMILTDLNFVIKKVALLSNHETLGYVRKLEKNNFFNQWNGKKLKEAKSVQIDGFTGATYTAKAVSKNVDFLLNNGVKKLPKK